MTTPTPPLRIPFDTIREQLERVLSGRGFAADRAALSARLFAEASLDGVASHGLNRFSRFIRQIELGVVVVDAEPKRVAAHGAWEQWDGQLGPGNLNAHASTARAIQLAGTHGVGCVALGNTNHWMRGGAYGWQAAARGVALVAWTNTMPNMPPWGASSVRVGNNPLIIAIPRGDAPVVLDMAMAQFSYGQMESYERRGAPLPVPGGFDETGQLSTDAGAILRSQRMLPIGYWKGSGLALALDLLAALLSGGRSTADITPVSEREVGLSQIFLAFEVARRGGTSETDRVVNAVLEYLRGAVPLDPASPVRYPGERVLQVRAENMRHGVPVDPDVWRQVCAL